MLFTLNSSMKLLEVPIPHRTLYLCQKKAACTCRMYYCGCNLQQLPCPYTAEIVMLLQCDVNVFMTQERRYEYFSAFFLCSCYPQQRRPSIFLVSHLNFFFFQITLFFLWFFNCKPNLNIMNLGRHWKDLFKNWYHHIVHHEKNSQ